MQFLPQKYLRIPCVMDTMQTLSTKEEVLPLEDIEFGLKWLMKEKAKSIE